MAFHTLVFIALALAMDAFAASISAGLTIERLRFRHAAATALLFAGFQAAMPLFGWMIAHGTRSWVSAWDHWVAFALLVAVGGKALAESAKPDGRRRRFDPSNLYALLLVAVATSIDAFAIGMSISYLEMAILRPVLVIGAITLLVCLAGVYVGDVVGHLFERQIEAIGGLILIGIGLKIVIEHVLFQ